MTFTKLQAFQSLTKLAKSPIDLREALTPERVETYQQEVEGLELLWATERVNDNVLDALFQLAEETQAIKKMEQMQNGEKVNKIEGFPSEDRPALHTATRNFFHNNSRAKEATEKARKEIEKLKSFQMDPFTNLIMIGIGGSYLGPEAHYLALNRWKKEGKEVHFLANVDPDEVAQLLTKAPLEKTLVLLVSKSGTTLETLTNATFIQEQMRKEGLDPKKHFVAITQEKSALDKSDDFLEIFYMWDWIGGRYSTTSMVGGVMLTFAYGFDIFWEFLKGAHAMDEIALNPDPRKNLPLLNALLGIWNRNFLGASTNAVIPYSYALRRFPAHLQQLDMESNGKQIDKNGKLVDFGTGPILWGEIGTDGQHSFFQLLHQGTHKVGLEFIGFKESQYGLDLEVKKTTSQQKLLANLLAQSIALATGKPNDNPNQNFPGNRPSRILLAKQLTPYTLGQILAYFEHKVAFQGFIWNINSFDQEGVQLGKKIANRILDRFSKSSDPYPIADIYLKRIE